MSRYTDDDPEQEGPAGLLDALTSLLDGPEEPEVIDVTGETEPAPQPKPAHQKRAPVLPQNATWEALCRELVAACDSNDFPHFDRVFDAISRKVKTT